tara:strand:- start:13077 stop:15125 length:2049 start_codon:yes stop_codon:yes gene_type:complete
MVVLKNALIRLAMTDSGELEELTHLPTGHNYASGGMLWRLYFQRGDQMDREIVGSSSLPKVTATDDTLTLIYDGVQYQQEQLAICVTITVKLLSDETHWSMTLQNNQSDIILRECQFPLIHSLELGDRTDVLLSQFGGQMIPDLPAEIRKFHTLYKASDHLFLQMDFGYPFAAATNCYVFPGDGQSLYCACHDDNFEHTRHLFRLYGEKLECGFARYPSLEPGESCTVGTFVLSPHAGGWHVSADKYRRWADSWFNPPTPPQWVKRMKGWQRMILKHQYGEVHYDYSQLSEIHADGLKAGINSVNLFGWWAGGMDNSNPDYVIDEAMGGEEVLRDRIAAFEENGSVILYFNGRLIDVNTDYYKTVGKDICVKDKFGAQVRDAYRFRASGTYTGLYGNRTFVAACPWCEAWMDKMKEAVGIADQLGCKGVFFDQLGGEEFPCFDPSHGHDVPNMKMSWRKAELTRELRDYARSLNPKMGIGIELLSDVTAQQCDFIHNLFGYTEVLNDWETTGEKPIPKYFIEWFRYCFPEIIMTDRTIRDDTDIPRRVNMALLRGLRSDVEIYRCRKTIKETPTYAAYLKQANMLRDQYAEFLLEGRYVDTQGFACDNDQVEARAFVSSDRMAVLVTQSHLDQIDVTINVPGYTFMEHGGLGEWNSQKAGKNIQLTLPRHALAVLVYKKKSL